MGVNKVEFGDDTIIDISDSTVDTNNLMEGVVAYGANGERIVGSATSTTYTEGDGINISDDNVISTETRVIDILNADYEALTDAQKMDPSIYYNITDLDTVAADIDDTKISSSSVWSSQKVNDSLPVGDGTTVNITNGVVGLTNSVTQKLSEFDNLYDNGLLSDNFWNGANLSLSADGIYVSNGKLPKGTYKISCVNSVSGAYILYGLNSSGTWETILNGESYSTLNNGKSFTTTKDYSQLRIYTNVSVSGLNIQINSGTKKLPYTPYAMSNSAITEELSDMNWKALSSVTGKSSSISIPSNAKELFIKIALNGGESWVATIFIPTIVLSSSGVGYNVIASPTVYGSFVLSKTNYVLNASSVDGADKSSVAVTTIYYK